MEPIETPKLLENLFDDKKLKILKLFLAEQNKEFNLSEISKKANVPIATTHRIVNQLVKLGLLEQSKVKYVKLYMMASNNSVRFLETFLKEDKQIMDLAVEKLKDLAGLKQIIIQGKPTNEWANLLLIGDNLDNNLVKPICAEIKEKYKFTISTLLLTQEQYEQITSMGLYSGQRKTLYTKKEKEVRDENVKE